ncbi:hypothetical protein T09_12730 [Trichinella sp. T9]|nr:hypothetical protein T09_12730 [Trichinella sp. T9]
MSNIKYFIKNESTFNLIVSLPAAVQLLFVENYLADVMAFCLNGSLSPVTKDPEQRHENEDDEEINVVDVSDGEDDGMESGASCSRSSSMRSTGEACSERLQPLDLSKKSARWNDSQASSGQTVIEARPSVIQTQDVDEHFRKSLSFNPLLLNEAEVKGRHCSESSAPDQPSLAVDDHFARALGEVWWALKANMSTETATTANDATIQAVEVGENEISSESQSENNPS